VLLVYLCSDPISPFTAYLIPIHCTLPHTRAPQETVAKMKDVPAITIGGKHISGGATITQDEPPSTQAKNDEKAAEDIEDDVPTERMSKQAGQQEDDEISLAHAVNLCVTVIPFSS
jgi:hypothetical protein